MCCSCAGISPTVREGSFRAYSSEPSLMVGLMHRSSRSATHNSDSIHPQTTQISQIQKTASHKKAQKAQKGFHKTLTLSVKSNRRFYFEPSVPVCGVVFLCNLRNLWIYFPQPPPLGVSIRTRSPGSKSQFPLELSSSRESSRRMMNARPFSPSAPPRNP